MYLSLQPVYSSVPLFGSSTKPFIFTRPVRAGGSALLCQPRFEINRPQLHEYARTYPPLQSVAPSRNSRIRHTPRIVFTGMAVRLVFWMSFVVGGGREPMDVGGKHTRTHPTTIQCNKPTHSPCRSWSTYPCASRPGKACAAPAGATTDPPSSSRDDAARAPPQPTNARRDAADSPDCWNRRCDCGVGVDGADGCWSFWASPCRRAAALPRGERAAAGGTKAAAC